MAAEEKSRLQAPAPPDPFQRRWSFFFTYLLLFPLLLQLLFGAFSFSKADWLNWFCSILVRSALGGLFIFSACRLPRRAAPFLMGGVCCAAGLFNLLDIFLLTNFGTTFDWNSFQLMAIAPPEEIRGFFQLFLLRSSTFIILLLYPAAGIIIFKVKKLRRLWIVLLIFTGGILFYFNAVSRKDLSALPSPAARLTNFLQGWQNAQRETQMAAAAEKITASNDDENALCLLVIGESHSRRRSSLYGAPRETTPALKKLWLEKKIFRFDNAVTPHVMTHLALPGMLTLSGADIKNFTEFPSLPDIFRKGGFEVWYIYNQTPDDPRSLPFLAAARRADHFISLSNPQRVPDSRFIPELKKIIAAGAPKKLLILHLRGSHWKYSDNYPAEQRYFSKSPEESARARLLNEYDDSLRAVDQLLAELITITDSEKKNGFLLYLPDHGEALYEEDDFAGHTDLFPTAATAEIPLFLWLSGAFARPELRQAVKKNLKTPFYSSDLPHLMMELAGIKGPVFKPERSFINPLYKAPSRLVSTRHIKYETMKNRTAPTSEQQ